MKALQLALTELVHGFERLSADPSIAQYLRSRADPGFAWELSAASVSSLFGFHLRKPHRTGVETLVVSGNRDKAIPAWATRFFLWLSGLPDYQMQVIPNAGHLLFHDHLAQSVPLIMQWLDARASQ